MSIETTGITVTVDREKGRIKVTDPTGTETGTIRILQDGSGWTRTDIRGRQLATYNPDRDDLINDAVSVLTEGTMRPVKVIEAA